MSNFGRKFDAEWLAISGEPFCQRGQISSRPSGFVHFARYAAVPSLQRQQACAANETLISNKMDKIKTIRTSRSGSNYSFAIRAARADKVFHLVEGFHQSRANDVDVWRKCGAETCCQSRIKYDKHPAIIMLANEPAKSLT